MKETGPPSLVADAFAATLAEGHARHTALLLLATGPLIGVAWLTALVPGKPPTELLAQIPLLAPIVFASLFIGGLTLLGTGPATLGPSWVRLRPPRLAAFACACAAGGDLLMIASAISFALAAPGEVASGVPLLGAVLLSSFRLAITQCVVRRDITPNT